MNRGVSSHRLLRTNASFFRDKSMTHEWCNVACATADVACSRMASFIFLATTTTTLFTIQLVRQGSSQSVDGLHVHLFPVLFATTLLFLLALEELLQSLSVFFVIIVRYCTITTRCLDAIHMVHDNLTASWLLIPGPETRATRAPSTPWNHPTERNNHFNTNVPLFSNNVFTLNGIILVY
jgi:hypothetical protein